MSHSRYLSIISALALGAGTACCGGDTCGPGSAPVDGLELAGTGVDVKYTMLQAHPNNDCRDPNAPAGVVSLTINGTQTGTAFGLTLCIPRPDKLGSGALALGTDVVVVDTGADIGGGCTLSHAATPAPTGTVTSSGACGNGSDAAGFALTFENGVVPVKRTCGANVDVLMLALTGTVAVAGP